MSFDYGSFFGAIIGAAAVYWVAKWQLDSSKESLEKELNSQKENIQMQIQAQKEEMMKRFEQERELQIESYYRRAKISEIDKNIKHLNDISQLFDVTGEKWKILRATSGKELISTLKDFLYFLTYRGLLDYYYKESEKEEYHILEFYGSYDKLVHSTEKLLDLLEDENKYGAKDIEKEIEDAWYDFKWYLRGYRLDIMEIKKFNLKELKIGLFDESLSKDNDMKES